MKRKVRRMTPIQVARFMENVGRALAGEQVDKAKSIRAIFFAHFARNFMTYWYDASLSKSDGVADEFGNTWKPISEHTRIYRKLSSEEMKRYNVSKKRTLGLLTKEEHKLWKRIFASNYHALAYWLGEKEAKVRAAKIAWTVLKSMGARTMKDTFRSRDARILYATGRLINSLRPSEIGSGYYRPNKDQIATFVGGLLELGTKVPYVEQATKDRPLIPEQYNQWATRAHTIAVQKVITTLIENIQ